MSGRRALQPRSDTNGESNQSKINRNYSINGKENEIPVTNTMKFAFSGSTLKRRKPNSLQTRSTLLSAKKGKLKAFGPARRVSANDISTEIDDDEEENEEEDNDSHDVEMNKTNDHHISSYNKKKNNYKITNDKDTNEYINAKTEQISITDDHNQSMDNLNHNNATPATISKTDKKVLATPNAMLSTNNHPSTFTTPTVRNKDFTTPNTRNLHNHHRKALTEIVNNKNISKLSTTYSTPVQKRSYINNNSLNHSNISSAANISASINHITPNHTPSQSHITPITKTLHQTPTVNQHTNNMNNTSATSNSSSTDLHNHTFTTNSKPNTTSSNTHNTPIISNRSNNNSNEQFPRSFTVNNRPYFTLSRLGRGGSSTVYRVLSKEKVVCALKEVRLEENDTSHVANYQSEIDLLTRLRGNPRVIELLDYEICLDRNLIYMVLECGQTDLDHLLRERRRKEKQQRERGMSTLQIQLENESLLRHWWHEILRCVLVCHQYKVIHLDLKPSNFVSVNGRLKIIDFGIAKQVESNKTSVLSESALGTLNFMSPESLEQTTGAAKATKLNRASDVWSLGCILYQLTFGKPPFDHLDLVRKVFAITNKNYIIEYPSHPNHQLLDVIKRCLQRNPRERPTIEQLLQHGFLYPSAFPSVSKQQLVEIVAQLMNGQTSKSSNEQIATELYRQLRRGDKIDIQEYL